MATFWEMMKQLAESPAKAAKRTVEEYPFINKLSDLATKVAETPGADIGMGSPMMGLTRTEATTQLLKGLLRGRRLEELPPRYIDEIKDSIKYLLHGAPRKPLEELKEIYIPTPGTPWSMKGGWAHKTIAPYGEHKSLAGIYQPIGSKVTLPTPRIAITPFEEGSSTQYSLPMVLSHELGGHGSTERLLKRLGGTFENIPYHPHSEAAAELLGKMTAKKAGLERPFISSQWRLSPHTTDLEQMISILGEKSDNPYRGIAEFLKAYLKVGGK
jgi:hypothetical protein